jgi:hypothetical protein
MCAAIDTMPVAITMPKLAGDMSASALRQAGAGREDSGGGDGVTGVWLGAHKEQRARS